MARQSQTKLQLAQKVSEHAIKHYDNKTYAWDIIAECWTLDEIAFEIERFNLTTQNAAISHFRALVKDQAELRAEIQAA